MSPTKKTLKNDIQDTLQIVLKEITKKREAEVSTPLDSTAAMQYSFTLLVNSFRLSMRKIDLIAGCRDLPSTWLSEQLA